MQVGVIGGTGTLGPHVVRALVDRGVRPRVLTRDPARAATVLPAEVTLTEVDLYAHDDVVRAAAGLDAVLLLTSHALDMTDLQLRIVRALRGSGTKIVKISGTSTAITPTGPYTARQHWEIETVLLASAEPFVMLRPNSFLQTLVGQLLIPAVEATGVVLNPIDEAGISFVDARDVGECAALALTAPDWDGQTLRLTGPRAVTYREIAASIERITGRPVEVRDTTPADLRATLTQRGVPDWEAGHFEHMYQLFRDGQSAFVSDDVETMTGHRPRDIDGYLAEILSSTTSEAVTR